MDSHNLEPQEYTDRVKVYSQKLSQQWSNVRHPTPPGPKGLLADIPSEAVLRKPPISAADLQMVRRRPYLSCSILSVLFNQMSCPILADKELCSEGCDCCERHPCGTQGRSHCAFPNPIEVRELEPINTNSHPFN